MLVAAKKQILAFNSFLTLLLPLSWYLQFYSTHLVFFLHIKIVNGPRVVESQNDRFEVFYIDYGNQESLPYSRLRPLDPSVSSAPGLAQLCSLAYIKVPSLDEDFGQEAAQYLSERTLSGSATYKAQVEEKDLSGGKVKGQGTGPILFVTLIDESGSSINADMLQVC